MIEPTTAAAALATYNALRARCADLDISLWHCDLAGQIRSGPPFDQAFQDALLNAAKGALADPVAYGDGWILFLEFKHGSRRGALNAAVLKNGSIESARLLAKTLRWNQEDLAHIHGDSLTIDQFSEKLSQAYEETNLLYRMAKLLNTVSDPADAVATVSSQLQQVLPFGWLAIQFSDQHNGVRELAAQTLLSGKPPFEQKALVSMTQPMLNGRANSANRRILNPLRDPLAAMSGSEVLCAPITHDDRVIGLLLAGNKHGPDSSLSSFETQFLEATADFLGVFHENLARFAEQQEMSLGMLRALSAAIDAKDRYTGGHSERVGLMAMRLAQSIGLDKVTVEQYRIAGIVHDVGKIGVPEAVLTKPGRLTEEEFAQIKLHPSIGHNILRDIPALNSALPGVLSHHERWDGRGYPQQLAGEEIPLIARVLALADTFDAMSSNRSYRPALPRPKVLEEIRRSAGTQFDPSLVPHFVELDFSEFDHALETHRSLDQKAA